MTKAEVCEALERAIQQLLNLATDQDERAATINAQISRDDAALLCTLKARINGGFETDDCAGQLIIAWSDEGEER